MPLPWEPACRTEGADAGATDGGWGAAAALSAAALPACGGAVAADTVAWEPCTDLAAYVTDLGVDDSVVDRLQCASLESR
ncbi:hypothetical protein GS498_21110 [Rhodococcus hoagii]|nr:hypothetical protein [Prescottella equi]